jgi:hypothetical protein
MHAIAGQALTTTLVSPGGDIVDLGARIEVPVTREIAGAWTEASQQGATWTVTIDAPSAAGDYLLVWRTGDPEPPAYEAFLPLTVTASSAVAVDVATADELTPTVAEVAALLHARTFAGGEEVGTFDGTTSPTGAQVAALITMAVGDVIARIGVGVPSVYAEDAQRLAALQAASLVEASYFPNELDTDRSAYRQYQAMFLNGIDQIVAAARRPSGAPLV